MSTETCDYCGSKVPERRRGTGFCSGAHEDAQSGMDRESAAIERENQSDLAERERRAAPKPLDAAALTAMKVVDLQRYARSLGVITRGDRKAKLVQRVLAVQAEKAKMLRSDA